MSRSVAVMLAILLPLVVLAACDRAADGRADPLPAGDSTGVRGSDVDPGEFRSFDPDSLVAGDTVGGLVVTTRDLRVDLEGRTIGTVRFAGEVTLSGRYHPHFDYPEVRSTCFEADDSSAVRLPRFRGDERRVWFCFDNQEEASRLLGPPGSSGDATIVIDQYSTIREQSDAVDGARLVRVLSRAPEGSGGPPPGAGSP